MKKILFVVQGCRQGGANRSLQYLLQALQQSAIEPSVFALSHQGSYKTIFSRYYLLYEDFLSSTLLADLSLEKPTFRRLIRWILRSVFRLLRIAGFPVFGFFFNKARRQLEKMNFDAVIAFQEGTATTFAAPIQVPLKIAWIHSDYSDYLRQAGSKPEIHLYQQFHRIVCVSEYTAGIFRQLLPSLSQKVSSIPNVMDQQTIRRQSLEAITHPGFQPRGMSLLCVGRLHPVKQFTAIPALAAQLKKSGLLFRWFIIGGGPAPEKEAILREIHNHSVDEEVIMLGELDNPYPYIAASDVMISVSLSEACPLGVQEAKILHVPVVSTDFGSAAEFVTEGKGGKIVPLTQLADKLIQLLSNEQQLKTLKQELEGFEFDNQTIVSKIEELVIHTP